MNSIPGRPQIVIALVFVAGVVVGALVLQGVGIQVAGAPGSPPPSSSGPDPKLAPRPVNPSPLPTPRMWAASSAAEVAANVATDTWAAQQLRDLARNGSPLYNPAASGAVIGVPVRVPSLRSGDAAEWLIPVTVATRGTVGVFVAPLDANGSAFAAMYTGWEGQFPHALSSAEAKQKGGSAADPVTSAELVWGTVGQRQGYLAGPEHPFYKIVRGSGAVFYLYATGDLVSADAVQ